MDVWKLLLRFFKIGQVPQAGRPPSVNQFTIKFLVGLIAISLPILEFALTGPWGSITSISESFWYKELGLPRTFPLLDTGDWPRTILTGTLFAISALLLSFNGEARTQGVLARVAGIAAAVIALFPCKCRCGTELIGHLHYAAAGVMYAVLTWFCIHFLARAHAKAKTKSGEFSSNAKIRRAIYAVALIGMGGSLAVLTFQSWIERNLGVGWDPVFVGEAGGLISFGVSWITASRTIPGITTKQVDRERLFG